MTRTLAISARAGWQGEIYDLVAAAQAAGVVAAPPGADAGEADATARDLIEGGYGGNFSRGAGVAEVVLLSPPCRHPPAHLPGRQAGAGREGVDLPVLATAAWDAAGDLPQADLLALAGAFGDLQGDRR